MSYDMGKLFLAYSDHEVNSLKRLKDEYDEVDTIFSEKKTYDFKQYPFTTREKLIKNLRLYQNELEFFGYSGHADGENLMTEEDATKVEGLAILLGQCENLKVVLLNGCSTENQVQELVKLKIPVVIYTKAAVNDCSAKEFAVALFNALVDGKTIGKAVEYAKGVVKTKYVITFQHRRGLELGNIEIDEWGIYIENEQYLTWTLLGGVNTYSSLFCNPEHNDTFKCFFLGDKNTHGPVYSLIKRSFITEEENKTMLFQDIWDISDELNQDKILEEIKAANAIILAVDSDNFFTNVWKKIPEVIAEIKKSKKPVMYLHVIKNENEKEYILKTLGYSVVFELLNYYPFQGSLLDYNDRIRLIQEQMIDGINQTVKKIKEGSIPHDDLVKALKGFDLDEPTKLFNATILKGNYFHFFMIEGTECCGQDFLLYRLKKIILSVVNKDSEFFPLHFFSNTQADKKIDELWKDIADVIKLKYYGDTNNLPQWIAKELLGSPLVLVFDNVITRTMELATVEENNKMLQTFWESLCEILPQTFDTKTKFEKIFVFAVNRGYSEQRKFTPFEISNKNATTVLLPEIKKIEPTLLPNWYIDNKEEFVSPDFDIILHEASSITGDGFLGEALTRLCTRINCKPVYQTITQW